MFIRGRCWVTHSKWYCFRPYIDSLENISGPNLIQQTELKDLGLSKHQAEFLGSRFQEWNLVAKGKQTASFRKMNVTLSSFYNMQDSLFFCTDISGLMEELRTNQDPTVWRLFIDSSKFSFKAVLLHDRNQNLLFLWQIPWDEINLRKHGKILTAIKYDQ